MALCLGADLLFPPCLAIYGLIYWRGGWRIAAAAPLLVTIPGLAVFLHTRRGERPADSVTVLLFAVVALLLCTYSVVVLIVYRRRKSAQK